MWRKSGIDHLHAVASSSYHIPANHCSDSHYFSQGHQFNTSFLHSFSDLDKFDILCVRDGLFCGRGFSEASTVRATLHL